MSTKSWLGQRKLLAAALVAGSLLAGGAVLPTQANAEEAAPEIHPIGAAPGGEVPVPSSYIAAMSHESVEQEGSFAAQLPNVPEAIYGDDGRIRVSDTNIAPNSAIVYIHDAAGAHKCTGFLVSPDTVVTAGHCVFDRYGDQTWNWDLQYSPGANGAQRPFGTAKATQIWSDTAFVNHADVRLDWGVVKLDRAFPSNGYFGMRWQSTSLDGTKTSLRGYPSDKGVGELWGMGGSIVGSLPNNLCYDEDTFFGQSGSPVYSNSYQVLAIHAYGIPSDGCPSQANMGTRVTKGLFNLILSLR